MKVEHDRGRGGGYDREPTEAADAEQPCWGPLTGLSVLDMSLAMAGPFAAQKLGDLGADVLKIEPVGSGEWHRSVAAGDAWLSSMNCSFLAFNRNKRSLAVDLKKDSGQQIVQQLVGKYDVVLQNFRPGVAERLGVGYDQLRRINPSIVYCSMSGYGSVGPNAGLPGQDLLIQAYSGALWNVGAKTDGPQVSPFFVADATAAHLAVEGILAAVVARSRSGKGQHVQVNLLDAVIDLQTQEFSVYCNGGVGQERGLERTGHVYLKAPYGVFETRSGWIAISMGPLQSLAKGLRDGALAELAGDEARSDRDLVYRLCRAACKRLNLDEAVTGLRDAGHWAGPVLDYRALLVDEQVAANQSFVVVDHPTEGTVKLTGIPIKFSETPGTIRLPAPQLGADTLAVLRELAFSEEETNRFLAEGVVQAK